MDSSSQFALAIARGWPSDTFGYLFGALVSVVLLFTGLAIAITTLILRLVRRRPA